MPKMKPLLLGTAAALSLGGAARAADMPVAAPVEYVRICDAYGAGFFFIPGTDTCLRISGYVRFQVHAHSNRVNAANWDGDLNNIVVPGYVFGGTLPVAPVPAGAPLGTWYRPYNGLTDTFDMWTRALVRLDARSNTEWGILRSFIEWASGGDNGANPQVRYAFVQIGPVTAGLTDSFFNFDGLPTFGTVVGGPDGVTRRNVLAYTAAFGNGLSATISLEDASILGAGGSHANIYAGLGTQTGWFGEESLPRRGIELPDLVANLRLTQGWGTAQLSAAVTSQSFRNTNNCYSPGPVFLTTPCEYDEIGWAVRGGVKLNLDMLARGSNAIVSAAYAEGALHYLGGGFGGTWQRSFWPQVFDPALIVPGSGLGGILVAADTRRLYTISGWSIAASLQHFFTPALRGAIFGGYAALDYGAPDAARLDNVVALDRAWSVGTNLVWTPVRNLDLGVELFYLNARFAARQGGFAVILDSAVAGPVSHKNEDAFGAIFRIQRSF